MTDKEGNKRVERHPPYARVHVEVDSLGVVVPFTQYIRPRGVARIVLTHVPASMFAKVKAILDAGYVFECEILSDGRTVSMTVTDPEFGDFGSELCHNNREVPQYVAKMIHKFDIERNGKARDRMRADNGENRD